MKHFKCCLLIVFGMVLAPYDACAEDSSDTTLFFEAKISLTQAIDAAEQHLGGRAIEGGFDGDSFKPAYEIEVIKDGKIYDVQVDGVSGAVLDAREDTNG